MGIIGSKRVVKQSDKTLEAGDSSFVFSVASTETRPLIEDKKDDSLASAPTGNVETSIAITDAEKNLEIYKKEQATGRDKIVKKKKEGKKQKLRPHYKTSDLHETSIPAITKGQNPLDKPKMMPIKSEVGDTISKHVPVHLLTPIVSKESEGPKDQHGVVDSSTNENSDGTNDGKADDSSPYTLTIGCPRRPAPPRHSKLPPLNLNVSKVREMDFMYMKTVSQTKPEVESECKDKQTTTSVTKDSEERSQMTTEVPKEENQTIVQELKEKAEKEKPQDEKTSEFFGKIGEENVGDAAMLKIKMYNLELN